MLLLYKCTVKTLRNEVWVSVKTKLPYVVSYNFWQSTYTCIYRGWTSETRLRWLQWNGIGNRTLKCIASFKRNFKYIFCSEEHYVILLQLKNKRPNKLRCNLNSRPRNRAFRAHHWNAHKSTPNKHATQEWCETGGKYLRKWRRTWIMIYFEAQNGPDIGPVRPMFNTTLKVAQIDMYTKTHAKPVENFWKKRKIKMTKDGNFYLFGGPKWSKKLGL